jgi:hypothetical protein
MNVTSTRSAGISIGVGSVSFCSSVTGATAGGPMSSPGIPIDTLLLIDGREHRVSHDIRASLFDTLRDYLGFTAAQAACEQGQCGACTVLIDGNPERSCLMLTVAAQGREINGC